MEPLQPQDPHHIGPYRLLARLGAGGMGQVYLGHADAGPGDRARDHTGGQAPDQPADGARDQTGDGAPDQSGDRARNHTGDGARDQAGGKARDHTGDGFRHPIGDRAREHTGGQAPDLPDPAGDRARKYIGDHADGRTAAVKLIHPHLAAQPDFRTRFRREVTAARLVGGAWTAPVLDADPDAPIPWLATAYVPGPSLRQAVGRDFGRLPTGSVRALAQGLAYALQDIHRAGLVHRDLKPANILLTPDGPRVIDFGIARSLAATADPALTRTGELLGSPGFLAPEQIHGTPVTPACDVFGLGAVLAYAATGRLPFGDAEQPGGIAGLLLRIAEAEPELGDVAPELRDLVRDCLRKEPTARPTPAEVLARIGAGGWTAPDPWLPEPLTARLRHGATAPLDREDEDLDRPAPTAPYRGERSPARQPEREPEREPESEREPGREPARDPEPESGREAHREPEREPSPRAGRRSASALASTAFLLVVAAVVAVAAGGTVYTVMSSDDGPAAAAGAPPAKESTPVTPVTPVSPITPAADPPEPTGPSALPARLPDAFAGTWRTTSGAQAWRLILTPGAAGSPVMSLTVQAPGLACSWTAPLRSAAPGTVGLETSAVTSGTPPTCSPGGRSTLRLLPDGTLVRELEDGPGPPLAYHRE
ncbi:Serine/threonine-protein kinase PknD [Streptomyces avidinii]